MPIAVARPSSRYRAVIIFSLLAVMLLGFFALGRLSLDLPPSSDVPRVSLQFAAPGLIAPVIEEKLTARLESVLADVSGVAAVESVTATGRASIDLRLDHRRNIDMVQREARAIAGPAGAGRTSTATSSHASTGRPPRRAGS